MKRPLTILLATATLLLTGLIAAPAAQAAPATDLAPSSCINRDRFTWAANQYFNPGDCYQTPGAALVMQFDGNFVLYYSGGGVCSSHTAGYHGTVAVFQGDGNLVLYYGSTPIAASGTDGNPNSRMILRGDGTVMIRNQAGNEIWRFC